MSNRSFRFLLMLCAVGIFIFGCVAFIYLERQNMSPLEWLERSAVMEETPIQDLDNCCMGVPIISKELLSEFSETDEFSLSRVLFNGLPVAADEASRTIYIPQGVETMSDYRSLRGILDVEKFGYSLRFLDTEALNSPKISAEQGEALRLMLCRGRKYMPVNVIISSYPIVRIESENYTYDKEAWEVFDGEFSLWDPESAEPVHSLLEWKRRGGSTKMMNKRSWKLSLKAERMDNNHCNLLNMGEDDDWILNPMVMDDLRTREYFAIELWNKYAVKDSWNYPMSMAKYVELVINGEYQGLYMLQRRVDEKYLELDREEDILLKGTWLGADRVHEVVYSPYGNDRALEIFSDALVGQNGSTVNVDSFIDVNLFVNYLSAYDNAGINNMFYLLKKTANGHELYFIPWDTDMSLGIAYHDEFGFSMNYEGSLDSTVNRMEYGDVQLLYPQLDELMAQRWHKLRENMYSDSTISETLRKAERSLSREVALDRDAQKWGYFYAGTDNFDSLYKHGIERLYYMDSYYSK